MTPTKKKNPLFVVTENGRIVQEAKNNVEAYAKKMGLGPVYNIIHNYWETLLSILQDLIRQFGQNYGSVLFLQAALDSIVKKMEEVLKYIYPQSFIFKG